MPEDTRNRFDEDVFTWRATKSGKLLISYEGQVVTTLSGTKAEQLIAKLDAAEDRVAVQHLLARATGNFRRGNEREAKRASRR